MEDDELSTPDPDIDVWGAGGNIRCVATSERGQRWFFGACPPDLRSYFFYRAYGDTSLGWFEAEMDGGFERLLKIMQAARLRVRLLGDDLYGPEPVEILPFRGRRDDR